MSHLIRPTTPISPHIAHPILPIYQRMLFFLGTSSQSFSLGATMGATMQHCEEGDV